MVDAMEGNRNARTRLREHVRLQSRMLNILYAHSPNSKHSWCSGNIGSSHGLAPGSTPGGCMHFVLQTFAGVCVLVVLNHLSSILLATRSYVVTYHWQDLGRTAERSGSQ